MNAGIDILLSEYPLVNIIFLTGNYKIRNVGTINSPDYKPPYEYETPEGRKWIEYYQAVIENAKRIGVGLGDMYYGWGVKNAYTSLDKVTVDGSHFNTYGYYMFARWLNFLTSVYM